MSAPDHSSKGGLIAAQAFIEAVDASSMAEQPWQQAAYYRETLRRLSHAYPEVADHLRSMAPYVR